jgi:diguanylate cyclase (GGDEF)-like protein
MRAEITAIYDGESAEAAQLRGAHMTAVMRLTPPMMFANVGSSAVVLWTYAPDIPLGLWIWFAVLCGVCGLAMLNWWKRRGRTVVTASSRSLHRATLHAALLSGVWAVMQLLWFPNANIDQQITIATLVTGMIGAGSFVLSPLPYASLAWVALFTLGAQGGLWLSRGSSFAGMALLIGLYSPMVLIGAFSAWRKSTALIQAQTQSAQQEQMLAVLLQDFEQNAGDALWETDSRGELRHASARLQELLRLPAHATPAGTLLEHLARRCPQGAEQLQQLMSSGQPFRNLQLPMQNERGTTHLLMNGKCLTSESGEFLGWRGVLSDVTEKVNSEQMLRQLAHTDSLTGLANRFMLRETLSRLVAQKRPLALLAIDLDRFKAINDNHGHSTGDAILRVAATRLKSCAAADDTLVARLGGDEFALVVSTHPDVQSVQALAQRLVDVLAEPIKINSRLLRVGASVGITFQNQEPVTLDDLLVQADMALYAAKDAGRGRWARYTPILGDISRRRLAIEQGLRTAQQRGELALHWQPKVDLSGWHVTGAEALMRWTHPKLGPISPGEFITVAEQCGMIDALGQWALREACRAGTGALAGLTVSVNVSPIQLQSPGFLDYLNEALAESGLPPGRLELELTESVFIEDPEQTLHVLNTVRNLGVRLALDDFGTGYSSLSYLRSFPFDTLKIDRAFVTELMSRENSLAIVRMIAELAATLGMRTVCEGIETLDQMQAVRAAGCNEIQGYLFSPPIPLHAFKQAADTSALQRLAMAAL